MANDKIKEEEEKDEWATAKMERKYRLYLKSQGISPNELARLFYEGKLKRVDEIKEEPKKEEKKEEERPTEGMIRQVSSKIQQTVEDVAARQVEAAVAMAEENFRKRMQELEERAKKADELEKKLLEKEKQELEEKLKYLQEHRESIKKEISGMDIFRERILGGERDRIKQLEEKVERILERLNTDVFEQYQKELERMTAFKRLMDEKFKEIFPEYTKRREEEKTDWDGIAKVLAGIVPTINNALTGWIATQSALKQVDLFLARAERAKNEKLAEAYLRRADLVMLELENRLSSLQRQNVGQSGVSILPGVSISYEDVLANMLSSASKEDIEAFRNGKLSLIQWAEENIEKIVEFLGGRPDLVEQVRNLTADRVIAKISQVRKDIQIDEVMRERIRSELEAIKAMILQALEGRQ